MKDSPTARHWARLKERAPELYEELYALYKEDARTYMQERRKKTNKYLKPGRPPQRKPS